MTTAPSAPRSTDRPARRAGLVLEALARHARERPGDAAIIESAPGTAGRATTWSALERACRVAASAVAGPGTGAPVVLSAPNGPEFVAVFLGVIASGRHVLPVPPSAGPGEIARVAHATGAALVIAGEDLAARLPQGTAATPGSVLSGRVSPAPAASDAGGVLLQSSGTTGMPKIARRSPRALDAVALAVAEAASLTPADRVLAAIPMSHSYGMENALLAPLLAGAAIVCTPALDAAHLDAAWGHGVTVFPAVPFLIESLAPRPPNALPRPRLVYSAGAPLPRAVAAGFESAWGVRVGRLYGATEIGSVTFADPSSGILEPDSVGAALRGCDIVVTSAPDPSPSRPLDPGVEGHVLVRADSMLDGYLDAPDPQIDGYFPTGDLGIADPRGNLRITGRLKLMIDIGGAKVNPLEVEAVLASYPGIAECVVVPAPVSQTVSRLRAVIVPRDPGAHPREPDLRAFARERLAAYKVPRLFDFRDSLPRSPTGKILRSQIESAP